MKSVAERQVYGRTRVATSRKPAVAQKGNYPSFQPNKLEHRTFTVMSQRVKHPNSNRQTHRRKVSVTTNKRQHLWPFQCFFAYALQS